MVNRLFAILIVTLVAGAAVAAQTPAPSTAKPGSQTPPATKTAPPAVASKAPEPAAQLVNIKVELTIADQVGPAEPAKKSLSLIVADRMAGYVRTSAPPKAGEVARLNVDARPHLLPSGQIRLQLGLEYPSLNQSINLILDPGKPLVISQAADPTSDRKITVEVRASILK